MTVSQRVVRRSPDGRVTVSWPPTDPVRLFVHETDGTTGQIDLGDVAADLAALGLDVSPPAPGGVELGWLETPGGARFVVDGRRVAVVTGLELVVAGIVAVLTSLVRR
jgi:hypothetical protein